MPKQSLNKILTSIAYYALEQIFAGTKPGEATSEEMEDFWTRQFAYADEFWGPELGAGKLRDKDKKKVFKIVHRMLDVMEEEGKKLEEVKDLEE